MTHPIKLIQVMAGKQQGGAENFFARLYNALGIQPSIEQYGFLRHQSPYLAQLDNLSHISTHRFSQSWNPLIRHSIQHAIQKIDPDIVLTWMNRPSKLIGNMWRHKNYVHMARLGGFYNLKHYQHCDHFIANTTGIADYLIQGGIPRTKVHMISNFVEETPGKPLKRPDSPLVVAIGRLHPNKAFDTLIQAMTHVSDTHLWIIGDGPEKTKLASLITSLNLKARVKLLGWKNNPQDYLATADLFICPSRHEPLGNVILEAWYQQVAVLATKTDGALELIKDGENGCLCEIDDPRAMASLIVKILDNRVLRHKLSQAGLSTYLSRFSESIIVKQYLDLFHTTI